MATRYYVAPLVGDGLTPETAFRPSLAQYGNPYTAVIAVDAAGQPIRNWALCRVSGVQAALLADPDLQVLPNLNKDDPLSALTANQRQALLTALQNRGVDTSDITPAMLFRVIVRRLGRRQFATFDEDALDVSEP